jgi:hypothetical protein
LPGISFHSLLQTIYLTPSFVHKSALDARSQDI